MSNRTASRISFVFFIIVGILFGASALRMPSVEGASLGPQFFPLAMCALLILFCVLGLARTFRGGEDGRISLPDTKHIIFTVVFTAIFIISWSVFGAFYLQCAIYLFLLYTWYRPFWKHGLSSLALSAGISVSFALFVYLVFGKIMHMNF